MDELVEKWREFMTEWVPNNPAYSLDGETRLEGRHIRPQFDDFMDWLAFNNKS